MAGFWNRKTERAALQVADDVLTDAQIATEAGVTKRTLELWKQRPDFRARVDQHVKDFAAAIKGRGIAERLNRVDALNDRWRRMQRVIDERAADDASGTYEAQLGTGYDVRRETRRVPGWTTGLLVRTEKIIGTGPKAQKVVEFSVDTGLLSELRQHEKQAAQELGQWTEKSDLTSGGKELSFTLRIDRGETPGETPGGSGEAA